MQQLGRQQCNFQAIKVDTLPFEYLYGWFIIKKDTF